MKIYLASFKAKEAHRGGQYEIRSRLLSFHEISGNVFGAGLVYENILGDMASGTTARNSADQKSAMSRLVSYYHTREKAKEFPEYLQTGQVVKK